MHLPILSDRESYDDAATLLRHFGTSAALEAASRADASREVGNHINFCRWRQIERMIALLSIDHALGTVH